MYLLAQDPFQAALLTIADDIGAWLPIAVNKSLELDVIKEQHLRPRIKVPRWCLLSCNDGINLWL